MSLFVAQHDCPNRETAVGTLYFKFPIDTKERDGFFFPSSPLLLVPSNGAHTHNNKESKLL